MLSWLLMDVDVVGLDLSLGAGVPLTMAIYQAKYPKGCSIALMHTREKNI